MNAKCLSKNKKYKTPHVYNGYPLVKMMIRKSLKRKDEEPI